jgi:hypothetical protein
MNATVRVTGLRELQRSLKKADSDLYPRVREELKAIGEIVAAEARSGATGIGLVLTGRLVGSIKPKVRMKDVVVQATAKQRGFNYPVRYEFGDRNRPFLVPALAAKQGEIRRRLEGGVESLLRSASL